MRAALVAALVLAAAAPALAQPARTAKPARTDKPDKVPIFDMRGMGFDGTNRTANLLYFLERAQTELERASLERRSFIPEMVRTIDEEQL